MADHSPLRVREKMILMPATIVGKAGQSYFSRPQRTDSTLDKAGMGAGVCVCVQDVPPRNRVRIRKVRKTPECQGQLDGQVMRTLSVCALCSSH